MINFKEAMEEYEQHIKHQPLSDVQDYLEDLQRRLEQFEQYQDICDVYYLKMSHYFWNGQTLRALETYLEQRLFIEQYASKIMRIKMRYASCLLLDSLGFYYDHTDMLKELLKEAEMLKLHDLMIDIYNNLGYEYERIEQYDEAKYYYKACMKYYEQHPIKRDVSYVLSILNICHVYLKEKNTISAAYYLNKFERLPSKEVVFTQLIYLVRSIRYYLLVGNLENAKRYAERFLSLDLESIEYHLMLNYFDKVVAVYEALGNPEMVASVLERAITYADKLKSQRIQQYGTQLYQMAQEAELLDDLKKDVLTQAYTRASFEKFVSPLLSLQADVYKVLAIVDIDYFKQINDTHGHIVGDEMLKMVSQCANSYQHEAIKGNTQVFGRYGGDEFYFYFETTTPHEAEEVLRHFHQQLSSQSYQTQTLILPLSATIGAVYSRQTTKTFADWLKRADDRLYDAKHDRRGTLNIEHWEETVLNTESFKKDALQ